MDTAIPTGSGITCTPEEYAASLSNFSTHCLTKADSIGLTVRAAISFHDITVVRDEPLSL